MTTPEQVTLKPATLEDVQEMLQGDGRPVDLVVDHENGSATIFHDVKPVDDGNDDRVTSVKFEARPK